MKEGCSIQQRIFHSKQPPAVHPWEADQAFLRCYQSVWCLWYVTMYLYCNMWRQKEKRECETVQLHQALFVIWTTLLETMVVVHHRIQYLTDIHAGGRFLLWPGIKVEIQSDERGMLQTPNLPTCFLSLPLDGHNNLSWYTQTTPRARSIGNTMLSSTTFIEGPLSDSGICSMTSF